LYGSGNSAGLLPENIQGYIMKIMTSPGKGSKSGSCDVLLLARIKPKNPIKDV
jgi:hypothetical protein